jgi:aspartate 1-decarboxylase
LQQLPLCSICAERGLSSRAWLEATRLMFLTMLKSKLHRATVTGADLDYEGSIAIDRDLLDLSGILPHEQVDVFNINTGGRFTTYAIEAPRGSRDVAVNGAAARLVQKGDRVIIVAYCQIPAEEARNYHPTVVVLDDGNEVKRAA